MGGIAKSEPSLEGRWSPRSRLLFIVVVSGLLWAALFFIFRLVSAAP
jgi:hypothetical protein